MTVTAGTLEVRVSVGRVFQGLRPPFAAIGHIRNDAMTPLVVSVALDGAELCRTEIAPGTSRRVDCRVELPLLEAQSRALVLSGSATPVTVEDFELATHHGALTPGPRDLIVVPEGASGFRPASWAHFLLVVFLVAASVGSVADGRLSRWLSTVHLVIVLIVGSIVVVVIGAGLVSPYGVLIQNTFLERLLLLTSLPTLARWMVAAWRWWRRSRVHPAVVSVAAGLVVGLVFLAYAAHRIHEQYQGNPSGLLVISHNFFDNDPLVNGRADIRDRLIFDPGMGADGQFFYLMTFDPLMSAFRGDPRRYRDFIDNPPYRYGRIGFSWMTRVLSLGQPQRYPITMIAVVLLSLAIAGFLLSRIAQHHGLTGWHGLLIVFVPGFWSSVERTMPEPVAIALLLGGCLSALRSKWWMCGALLGAGMLVRETGGFLVLAVVGMVALTGKRRDAAIVALLAFVPILVWKAYLWSMLWPEYGADSVLHTPNNVGLPFAGVIELWTQIRAGMYFDGSAGFARAGISLALLTTAAAALGLGSAVKRLTPFAIAAGVYGLLTIAYNYDGVWLHPDNAQRLTADLFVALALVFVQPGPERPLRKAFLGLWIATAFYVFFGALNAGAARDSLSGWWL